LTAPLWPFAPAAGFTVAADWATQIIRSRGGEQRIALRRAPRLQVDHQMGLRHLAEARALMRGITDYRLRLPDWRLAVQMPAQTAGATEFATPFAPLIETGQEIVLWHDWNRWEVLTVTAAASDAVTASGALQADMPPAMLIPVHAGVAQGELQIGHAGPGWARGALTVVLEDGPDLSGSTVPASYLGHEIRTDPVLRLGDLTERVGRRVEVIDPVSGLLAVETLADHASEGMALTVLAETHAQVLAWDLFTHRRRGRQVPFWAATGARDFTPAAALVAGDPLVVQALTAPAAAVGLHLLVRLASGSTHAARVTAAATVTAGTALTLDPVLPWSAAAADVATISDLSLVRFDTDAVSMTLAGDLTMTSAVPLFRVTHEL
jgi:hypothetical protein